MRFFFVQRAQERPHCQRYGERQHHIRNQDARKQEQPHTRGHAQARVQSGAPAKRPDPKRGGEPCQRHHRKGDGNPRCPVMDAKNLKASGDHPIFERGFFEVFDSVQMRGNPVPRIEHVAGDLRLHGVDIVQE